jgi:hypothetical protein
MYKLFGSFPKLFQRSNRVLYFVFPGFFWKISMADIDEILAAADPLAALRSGSIDRLDDHDITTADLAGHAGG